MEPELAGLGLRKICMNVKCGKSVSATWKSGWRLRSGRLCELCEACGSLFEQGRFCETFHSDDAGWRTCNTCKKRVHCGCVASISSFALLDTGGVDCHLCAQKAWSEAISAAGHHLGSPQSLPDQSALRDWNDSRQVTSVTSEIARLPYSSGWYSVCHGGFPREHSSEGDLDYVRSMSKADKKHEFMGKAEDPQHDNKIVYLRSKSTSVQNCEDSTDGEQAEACSPTFKSSHNVARIIDRGQNDCDGVTDEVRDAKHQALSAADDRVATLVKVVAPEPSGSFAGKSLSRGQNQQGSSKGFIIPFDSNSMPDGDGNSTHLELVAELPVGVRVNSSGVCGESSVISKPNNLGKHRPLPRQLLGRRVDATSSPSYATFDTECNEACSVRVARPPGHGRGRNQLLPRYWPRITDQELRQIVSGDSTTRITPLFEKMLSASDAGRIGRLVLPKACAEAYFPPISQPEGLPMKIKDITGKEWVFQFRFWPNNNSRMYVLEGVTPCIQSMQLQAGDTVTFSRLEPEGKLVMGYRRAPASLSSQVTKKRGRPLGEKSKRHHLGNEDSLDLRTSWEGAQVLLRPPPSIVPTIVTVEGHEFEEYGEPPISTKRTIFTARHSGEHDQWAQCDLCGSWRKVPFDALVTARWMCSGNMWDSERASCSIPQEISDDELDCLLGLMLDEDYAIPGNSDGLMGDALPIMVETSGVLDALARPAAVGGVGQILTSSCSPPRATTKHPRHRSGCTCIVCIQPPSGKGPKHKQNCLCNVCVTVKRRFKTLMLRRKKRLSETESESSIHGKCKDEIEVSGYNQVKKAGCGALSLDDNSLPMGTRRNYARIPDSKACLGFAELDLTYSFSQSGCEVTVSKGQIDLNSQPEREDECCNVTRKASMRRLLDSATLPLDRYLKQQGIKSLFAESTLSAGPGGQWHGKDGNEMKKKIDQQSRGECQNRPDEETAKVSVEAFVGSVTIYSNEADTPCVSQQEISKATPFSA